MPRPRDPASGVWYQLAEPATIIADTAGRFQRKPARPARAPALWTGRRRGRMDAESGVDEEAVRRLVEAITHRIDRHTQVLLREPGRPFRPNRLRLALIQQGQTYPFELTLGEIR